MSSQPSLFGLRQSITGEECAASDMEKPSYYSVIPASVRYCPELNASEKLMYGEISSLCSKEGYCWATNRYFSELYSVDTNSVSRWIANLERCGFIATTIGRANQRKIMLAPIPKNVERVSTKIERGIPKNVESDQLALYENNKSNTTREDFPTEAKTFFAPGTMEFKLSLRLLEHILKRDPKYRVPDLQTWAKHIDLILRIDKRTPEEVAQVVDWCQTDPFWRTNILSTQKLRLQFSKLLQQANNGQQPKGTYKGFDRSKYPTLSEQRDRTER